MLMTIRKLPLTLLLMIMIMSTVSFLPLQEAKASTMLAYDDGTNEMNASPLPGYIYAVRFSLPPDVSCAKLLTARYYIYADPDTFRLRVMAPDQFSDLTPPFDVTPTITGWFDVDLTSKNIVVTGDFYIVFESLSGLPSVGLDDTTPSLRSFFSDSLTPPWTLMNFFNAMIRAVIEGNVPVGGVTLPTNKLGIVTPYLALAGLIAALSAVVVVKRRR